VDVDARARGAADAGAVGRAATAARAEVGIPSPRSAAAASDERREFFLYKISTLVTVSFRRDSRVWLVKYDVTEQYLTCYRTREPAARAVGSSPVVASNRKSARHSTRLAGATSKSEDALPW